MGRKRTSAVVERQHVETRATQGHRDIEAAEQVLHAARDDDGRVRARALGYEQAPVHAGTAG